jgi:hypothetical protein
MPDIVLFAIICGSILLTFTLVHVLTVRGPRGGRRR